MRLFGAVFALLIAAGATGSVSAAELAVVRGDTVERVAVDRAGPTVLRGGGTMRAMPPSETEKTEPTRVVAGRTLWIVDDVGRPKTACF